MPDNNNNPLDKLILPPAKDPADLKLTLTTIENKNKSIKKEIEAVEKGQKQNSDKLKKIISFVDTIKKQQKNNLSLNKELKSVVDELTQFKKVADKLDTPEQIKAAKKHIDGIVEDVQGNLQEKAKNDTVLQKLLNVHEKKMLETSHNKGFKSALDKVKSLGEWFMEKGNFFRRQTGSDFCSYISNTMTKGVKALVNKIPLLSSFVSVLKVTTKVFTWLFNGGIKIIEKAFEVFTKLAGIGWKAIKGIFNIITVPIKFVGNIFSEILKNILSTPFGFLSVVVLTGLSIYLFAKPFAHFVGKLFSGAWDWINKTFDDIFADQGKQHPILSAFENATSTVLGWFKEMWNKYTDKDTLYDLWDTTLSRLGNWTGVNIKEWFSTGITFIKSGWDILQNAFNVMYKSGVFDELLLLWRAIKSLVYTKEDIIIENLKDDNRAIISEGYSILLKREVEALVQNKVLQEFFSQYNGVASKEAINGLIGVADSVISNYLNTRKISQDVEKNKQILSHLNIDTRQLVTSLLLNETPKLNELKRTSEARHLKYAQKLNELSRIEKDVNIDSLADGTSRQLKELLGSNIDKAVPQNKFIQSASTSNLPSRINKLYEETSIPEYSSEGIKFADDVPVQPTDKALSIPGMSVGGIVRKPIFTMIGEGGNPEIVLPMNQDGLLFIYESMKDFIVKNLPEEDTKKQVTTKDIVRRVQNGKSAKPDAKVYDMKNLSNGIVGFR